MHPYEGLLRRILRFRRVAYDMQHNTVYAITIGFHKPSESSLVTLLQSRYQLLLIQYLFILMHARIVSFA